MKWRDLLTVFLACVCVGVAQAQTAGSVSQGGLGDFADGEPSGDDDEDDDNSGDFDDVDEVFQWVNQTVGIITSAREFYGEWEGLDSEVDMCGVVLVESSGPTVPSHCYGSDACQQCYSQAVHRINFVRQYIERARCITAANIKMANSAMSFGDTTSGVHGVAGLSWQLQGKPQIKQAVDKLKGTYTNKASQYLQTLDSALQQLGQCEAEHFNEQDWYQRYGWIYLNFMKSKYASPPE